MKKLHIATSPLTGTIFCGNVLKNNIWGSGKQDLTIEALIAVAEHTMLFKKHHGKDVIVSNEDGCPLFKITVERL